MNKNWILLSQVSVSALVATATPIACTQAERGAVIAASGPACEVLFSVVGHPELAPLCTTAVDVANAVNAVASANTADGGIRALAFVQPSSLDVYQWLQAHGAVPQGG